MRRRISTRLHHEVELNLTAMLDLAFQLLAFFILTFRPLPFEGNVSLHLPPPQPVTRTDGGEKAGADASNTNPLEGLNTLVVTVLAEPDGRIGGLAVAGTSVPGISGLRTTVKSILSDPTNAFDQLVIQVSSDLSYQALMDVLDVCVDQQLSNGEKLTKLSFVELAAQP